LNRPVACQWFAGRDRAEGPVTDFSLNVAIMPPAGEINGGLRIWLKGIIFRQAGLSEIISA
jgi:hypothetical protein